MDQQTAFFVLIVGLLFGGLYLARIRSARQHARERLYSTASVPLLAREREDLPEGGVRRWLYVAGYRSDEAPGAFWLATVIGAVAGAILAAGAAASGVFDAAEDSLTALPGNVGLLFMPIVWIAPLVIVGLFAGFPMMRVRSSRRARVQMIRRDLAPSLELFASMAQAGLGFDAALDRVLLGLESGRPLAQELRTFQSEVLAGTGRVMCYRRLAARVDLPEMSTLCSALVRAQEVGTSLASTMRQQADDLRASVREQALARAQSLPARMVFPLVICFLPGVFIVTLGPAFYGFILETATFGSTP